jgi:hypothetical protein
MAGDFDSKQPVRATSDEFKIDIDLIKGTAATVGSGVMTAGTLRVVLATDQPEVATNLTKVGGVSLSLGSSLSAASIPVVIASDQGAVPVSLAANQSVNVAQIAGTATTVGSGVMGAGTQRVVLATDQPDVAVNLTKIAGTATDVNTGNASNGTQRVVLASDQPAIAVNVGAIDDIQTYRGTGVDVAVNGTDTNTYSPAATRYFTGFDASASGAIKVELKIGTTGSETTRGVYFSTASEKVIAIRLPHRVTVLNTQSVLLIITNKDNQVQPVYSTIYSNI